MIKSKITIKKSIILPTLAGFALATSTHGALLVYEGFDYGPPGADQVSDPTDPNYNLLHNQPDGVSDGTDAVGLSGVWSDSIGAGQGSDVFMNAGSLSFGGLPTSGNHVRTDNRFNQDVFSRGVSAALDSGSDLWFTFLADKLQNNFSAAQAGVVISNGVHGDSQVGQQGGVAGYHGFGIAPTDSGNDWTAYGWDGTNQVQGGDSVGVTVGGGDVHLLGGHVSFGTGTGGADVFTLYDYNTATVGDHNLVTSIEVDADESLLDNLNVTRRVNTAYDEIRIGTTEADVIPEPSVAILGSFGLLALLRRRR